MKQQLKQPELPMMPPSDDAFAHWVGMPMFEQDDLMPIKQVVVSFLHDEDIVEFSKLVGQVLTMRGKSSIWFPASTELKTGNEVFASASDGQIDEPTFEDLHGDPDAETIDYFGDVETAEQARAESARDFDPQAWRNG
jgi:hypothetical protein